MPVVQRDDQTAGLLKTVERTARVEGADRPDVVQVKAQGEGSQRVQLASDPFAFTAIDEETYGQMRASQPDAPSGSKIVDFAKQFVNTPYVWGGSGPLGFDCSGFTQYVYKQVYGIDLPRVSYQQGQGGRAVDMGDLQPGDLIFLDNSSRNKGADHVGIYLGNGQYIDAPKPGGTVGIRKFNPAAGWWARRYA